jgi:hypothetical protein
VCDAVAATLDRWHRHGDVFAGDRDHVYDILGRLGLSVPRVALSLGLMAAIAARGAHFVADAPVVESLPFTVALYVLLVIVVLALRRRFRLDHGGRSHTN